MGIEASAFTRRDIAYTGWSKKVSHYHESSLYRICWLFKIV